MTFLHGAILFGLVALVIPPIIHLLSRRRFEVVEWAAMQFLQVSQKTRQKVLFEQLLLMLLRVLLIGTLVLAIASPVLRLSCIARLPAGNRLARLAGQTSRDIVLIVDGSYSMDYKWDDRTAHDAAKIWASDFLKDLTNGDRVAIIQAKQQPIPVLGLLTADRSELRSRLEGMSSPRGGVNWPDAMQEAYQILQQSPNPQKKIIILTDGQRQGWADPKTLAHWELLALNVPTGAAPRVWVVNVVPDRPDDPPNWSVSPVTANRAVVSVGREVKFNFDLQAVLPPDKDGKKKVSPAPPPEKIEFRVDDEPAGEKSVPRLREPSISMDFKRSFASTGSHLISVLIDSDALPGDNRRDFAIDVLSAIPVLIVDGGKPGSTGPRSSDFFRYAVAPPNHPQPSFLVKTISVAEFASQALTSPVTRDSGSLPRVLVLQNVTEISETQHRMIEEFVNRGGGVFVLLGPNCVGPSFNALGFRNGEGWLPARLLGPTTPLTGAKKNAFPVVEGIERTFLDPLKEAGPESFLKSTFSQWWKLDTTSPGAGSIVTRLNTGDPLLVEKILGKGRTLLMAVPLDDSWRTDLLRSHDFVRLCHESLYHLAAARSAEVNLQPRQPIVYRPGEHEAPGGVTIRLPDGQHKRLDVQDWPLVFEDTRETGVYKLTTDSGRVQYYVVQPDGNESALTTCTDQDRLSVSKLFPDGRFVYESDRGAIFGALRRDQNDPELSWLFLLLVIALLAAELAVTRAHVKKNPPVTE